MQNKNKIKLEEVATKGEPIKFYSIPKPVGYWVLHDNYTHFEVYKKPKWLWRKMTKILLGWNYKDKEAM